MAETQVSKLIKIYESSTGPGTGLEEHLNMFAHIGGVFEEPNSITQEDLERLARLLSKLLKLLKKDPNARAADLDMITHMIAHISSLATKKISQRKLENNIYIIKLGDQLVNLKNHLGILLGPAIIATLIEYSDKF